MPGILKEFIDSLMVLFGRETAIKISRGFSLLVVARSVLHFLFGWLAWVCFLPLLFADAVILYATVKLLNPQKPHRRWYIRWTYLKGMAALLIFIGIKVLEIIII